MSHANLQGADLQEAKLRYANLSHADRDSDFLSANLRKANIDGAKISENDVEYLEDKGDLSQIRVCLIFTEEVVGYEEYCNVKDKRDKLTAEGINLHAFYSMKFNAKKNNKRERA